jgi:hypothetical protein
MTRNVTKTLNNAMDSVDLINQINEGDFSYFLPGYTQEVIRRIKNGTNSNRSLNRSNR